MSKRISLQNEQLSAKEKSSRRDLDSANGKFQESRSNKEAEGRAMSQMTIELDEIHSVDHQKSTPRSKRKHGGLLLDT